MKRFGWIALCLALVVGLCACKKQPDEPVVSRPVSDVSDGDSQSQSTTSTTTTTTTGALVVTDTQGTAVTNVDGSLVTTHVTALPTTVRPVTDPSGSTVTKEDGTVQTEVVVPPHITVSTDAQGTTHTSYVPEQTVTSTTTTTTTTESSASNQSSSTTESTMSSTESSAPSQTTSTDSTTSTTKPTQQDVTNTVSLPAEGYTPDNRIKLGEVTLSGNTVSMVIRNITAVWESEDGKSYFEYTCFDKNNRKLSVGKIEFGYIQAKSSKLCTFDIPEGTVKVELTDFQVEYWTTPV